MSDYLKILNIKINKVDMGQAIDKINHFIKTAEKGYIITPNSEMIVMAQKDRELARILNNSTLNVPDGAGVVLASRLYGDRLKERVAGYDLMLSLLKLANKENHSVYLLGAKPGVVDISSKKIKEMYPDINICGRHHGYINKDNQKIIIDEINNLEPDILFVGMGVPMQEKFIDSNIKELNVKLAMAVGGSFDVLAGRVKRAPLVMQRLNLEWLYRLIQEPSRFGRMMALPKFVFLVLRDYLKNY